MSPLTLATFGWWEIISPTVNTVSALCSKLASMKAHACCVTGFPAAVVQQSLDGSLGYTWMGELHHGSGGAGLLIAWPWRHVFNKIRPAGAECRRRIFCAMPGSLLGVGVYGPCVGTLPVQAHKDWLADCISIAGNTARQHGLSNIWMFGDLNLRGIAPGQSSVAAPGSSHANLADHFKGLLAEVGWVVLETAATHIKGGALDVHITSTRPSGAAQVAPAIPGCPSDHFPTVAPTPFAIAPGVQTEPASNQRVIDVFAWRRDEPRWFAALTRLDCVAANMSACFHALAACAVLSPPRASQRSAVVTAVRVLFDVIVCHGGHAADLCRMCRQGAQQRNASADHLIKSARAEHQRLVSLASSHPADEQIASAARVQSNWVDVALASRSRLMRPFLHQSWIHAAAGGDASLQRWLSSQAARTNARLPTRTDREAACVVEFRSRIGRLDSRCCAAADEAAKTRMEAEKCRRTGRIRMRQAPPMIAARDNRELATSSIQPLFVTTATVATSIRRRPAGKASSKLPWAAMRAAASIAPWLELVHGTLEVDWAFVDFDDQSIEVEIEHLHKGRGKPADAPSSHRPLGIGHPLTSLRSDLLRLRQVNGLVQLAGASQLGGLRDPRMVVVARDQAACKRRRIDLPSAELAGDARFGYDGGRHCRFMESSSAAGSSDRDWLLTHRLLTGHTLHVRDCNENGCMSLIPVPNAGGGGTIQGLSISGPLYNPTTVACAQWSAAAVPFACTEVHPVVCEAYKCTRTLEPEGYWRGNAFHARSVAWAIERAIDEARHARTSELSLLNKCVDWMRALCTDAERLLALDMLGEAGGEAISAFVDDLQARYSSPWSLKLGTSAVSDGARHNGVVYEAGPTGKTLVLFDGFPAEATANITTQLGPVMLGNVPRPALCHDLLGVPGSFAPSSAAHWLKRTPALVNRASRGPILSKIGVRAAVGIRAAAGKATECPWPLIARRFYLGSVEAKISYLAPLVIGLHSAGLRVTAIQARCALAAVTGQVTWPKTLRMPGDLRRRISEDLGWQCWWTLARASAIMLLYACESDHKDFAHSRLCANGEDLAPGSWAHSVAVLRRAVAADGWKPTQPRGSTARKLEMATFRKTRVLPAFASKFNTYGALPWPWIAANGDVSFPRRAFEIWWQLRVLGATHPRRSCPWCPRSRCTSQHLEYGCETFAMQCWIRGVRPEEAFAFPPDPDWFVAALRAVGQLCEAVLAIEGEAASAGGNGLAE